MARFWHIGAWARGHVDVVADTLLEMKDAIMEALKAENLKLHVLLRNIAGELKRAQKIHKVWSMKKVLSKLDDHPMNEHTTPLIIMTILNIYFLSFFVVLTSINDNICKIWFTKLTYFCSCYRKVPNSIWEIFSEFLIFCNLFHEPLGE